MAYRFDTCWVGDDINHIVDSIQKGHNLRRVLFRCEYELYLFFNKIYRQYTIVKIITKNFVETLKVYLIFISAKLQLGLFKEVDVPRYEVRVGAGLHI